MESELLKTLLQILHFTTLPGAAALFCMIFFMAVDRERGRTLMYSLSLAISTNTLLKALFKVPRPWLLHPETAPFLAEGGYALPCLHVQLTTALLLALALRSDRAMVRLFCIPGIIGTAVVRVLSGVQSIPDVLSGTAAGLLCAVVICRFESSRTVRGIVLLSGLAAAICCADGWGAGIGMTVILLEMLEKGFQRADPGRTRFGKLYGAVLAGGLYVGLYILLPFLIEWLITPLWPGQMLIVFLLTLLPCLLQLFPVF